MLSFPLMMFPIVRQLMCMSAFAFICVLNQLTDANSSMRINTRKESLKIAFRAILSKICEFLLLSFQANADGKCVEYRLAHSSTLLFYLWKCYHLELLQHLCLIVSLHRAEKFSFHLNQLDCSTCLIEWVIFIPLPIGRNCALCIHAWDFQIYYLYLLLISVNYKTLCNMIRNVWTFSDYE